VSRSSEATDVGSDPFLVEECKKDASQQQQMPLKLPELATAGRSRTARQQNPLLELPAESLRSMVKVASQARQQDPGLTPRLTAAALMAASPSRQAAQAAVASVREDWASRPCTPGRAMSVRSLQEVVVEKRESETRYDERSEENENWKVEWKTQMRARLTSQLGGYGSGLGITRSVSKMVGGAAGADSVRHRKSSYQFTKVLPKSRMEQLVDSTAFHAICGLAIIANAVFIGIITEYSAQDAQADPPVGDPYWFTVANQIFVIIFSGEVLLRVVAKKWDFLFGDEWKWNVFDFLLATYSLVEEILTGFSLTYTRLIRGLRMVRVLRVIRVMRFFRELRLMVCSIIQSLVSLSWALLLLVIIMYLFSIIFMHAAIMYFHDGHNEATKQALQEHYGSVGTTMFSLLLAISGGVDWEDIVVPLNEISVWYKVLFAFYVTFVLIGVLNVLTSAFVQRACELSRLDRDLVIQSELVSNELFIAEMKAIFEEVDVEGSGFVDWEQFRTFIHNEQVQAYFATQQLDTSDARELFNLLDTDQDGKVFVEEFILGCKKLRGQAKSSDVATLLRENKRASLKHLRAMRKLEGQVVSITSSLQELGLLQEARQAVSLMGSPSNYSSGVQSPVSRSRSRTPAHIKP